MTMSRGKVIGTSVTIGVMILVGLFAWRVLFYIQQIRTGVLDPSDLSFLSEFTINPRIGQASVPSGPYSLTTDDDPSLGSADALVRIVEFADFGCPFSRRSSYIMRRITQKYGDRIQFIYRDFPVPELHPGADRAAEAGGCVQEQGKFWEFHDILYQNQGDFSEEALATAAERVNVDRAAFLQCLRSRRYEKEVQQDMKDGLSAGVEGTPTFFINGHKIPGSIPEDILDQLILSLSSQ